MLLLQAFGVRSAYLFAVFTSVQLISLVGNEVGIASGRVGQVSFTWAYGFTMMAFAVLGVEGLTTVSDPTAFRHRLTIGPGHFHSPDGQVSYPPFTDATTYIRMGKEAPAEFIIATLASASGFTFFPNLVPLFHRLSRPSQRRTILALAFITITTVALFAGPWWKTYDSMHPKRAGVQYTYNVSA